jgi:hypothetical protein
MKLLLFLVLLLPNIGNAMSCSQNLPVDVYMRCIERLYGGGGRVHRNEVIQHPQIITVSQNCSQHLEVDTFLTCLKNYIHKANFTDESQDSEEETTVTPVEI